jgi:hypothetical protein
MKYTITIKKTYTTKAVESDYEQLYTDEIFREIYRENPKANQYGYVRHEEEIIREEDVYTQSKEGEIDLMAVVTAFNKSTTDARGEENS